MTKFAAITSMDRKYFDRCGSMFLSSYNLHMKKQIPLYLYNEDNFDPAYTEVNLMGWNLGSEYEQFVARHKNSRVKTFAKKAFSIIDAMNKIDCDKLIWFDADCLIKQPIKNDILLEITPDDCVSTHFSVWHHKQGIDYHSCETGFFILNKKHKGFDLFQKTYVDIYTNDKTEGLRRFYDGEVYGKTVELVESAGHNTLNLNQGGHKTPIPRSIIAPYLAHYKAGVKDRIKNEI